MIKIITTLSLSSLLLFGSVSHSKAQTQVQAVSTASEYKASISGWEVDLNKAHAMSEKSGKPILANFTGTDWCGWCIRLKQQVFTTPEFKKWAAENVVLLEVDFPKRFKLPAEIQEQNNSLQSAFGVRGFPTLWVFNVQVDESTGKKGIKGLAKTGYVAGGPQAWISDLEKKLKK